MTLGQRDYIHQCVPYQALTRICNINDFLSFLPINQFLNTTARNFILDKPYIIYLDFKIKNTLENIVEISPRVSLSFV